MADHYISINRGVTGTKQTDFTTGTTSTTGDDIEIRIRDGASLSKKDVYLALEAFENFISTTPWVVASGADVAL